MTPAELETFLEAAFPGSQGRVLVDAVTPTGIVLRQRADAVQLRPGGTVSGPALMSLSDTTAWLAILARIGPVALAVTTSLHIDFLRRPAPADVVAEGTILKLGRRLGVVHVLLRSDGDDDPVAAATVTYSIPPEGSAAAAVRV